MADDNNGHSAWDDSSRPAPVQPPVPTAASPRSTARDSRYRPWPRSERRSSTHPEALQQDAWDAPPRNRLVYPKPREESKRDYEGYRFLEHASVVYEALRYENTNGDFRKPSEASLADTDVTIHAHFHVSAIEQSLAYWNEILDTTSFLQHFLELIGYQAPGFRSCRSSINPRTCLMRPHNNSDLKKFLENAGQTIMDHYMLLVGVAARKEGLRHQLRLLFHLGQSRGTDYSQRMVRKILQANNDLHIRHYKGEDRFDPCFLEGIAQGLAQIVHDLGRVINIADFECLKSGGRARFGRLKSFINLVYVSMGTKA